MEKYYLICSMDKGNAYIQEFSGSAELTKYLIDMEMFDFHKKVLGNNDTAYWYRGKCLIIKGKVVVPERSRYGYVRF